MSFPQAHNSQQGGSDSTKLLHKTGGNDPGIGVRFSRSVTEAFFNSATYQIRIYLLEARHGGMEYKH